MCKFIFILVFVLFFRNQSQAADPEDTDSLNMYQRVSLSYAVGGQIYNNNLIYNPGFSIQTSFGWMLNELVGVGVGAGCLALSDESFLPVFVEAIGFKKDKKSSPVIKMQIGYSYGWYPGPIKAEGYKFRGGVYLDAGLGRKFEINQKYSILFQLSYCHQFAHMEYKIYGGQKYTQRMNFDMFLISLGFIRH
jgi:hypothetical protein